MKLQNLVCSHGWFQSLDSFNGVSQQRLGEGILLYAGVAEHPAMLCILPFHSAVSFPSAPFFCCILQDRLPWHLSNNEYFCSVPQGCKLVTLSKCTRVVPSPGLWLKNSYLQLSQSPGMLQEYKHQLYLLKPLANWIILCGYYIHTYHCKDSETWGHFLKNTTKLQILLLFACCEREKGEALRSEMSSWGAAGETSWWLGSSLRSQLCWPKGKR